MVILSIRRRLQLALAGDLEGRIGRNVNDKYIRQGVEGLTLDDDAVGGPWVGPAEIGEPDQGYIGRGTGASVGGSVAVVEPLSDSTYRGERSWIVVDG